MAIASLPDVVVSGALGPHADRAQQPYDLAKAAELRPRDPATTTSASGHPAATAATSESAACGNGAADEPRP